MIQRVQVTDCSSENCCLPWDQRTYTYMQVWDSLRHAPPPMYSSYIVASPIFFLHSPSGNHTPSTKPILPERVTMSSGNEISIVNIHCRMTEDELHNGAERGPVDRDGVRRTKSKPSTISSRGLRASPGRLVCL